MTSPQAAALRDVLTTLARRMPGIAVILYPAPVQGEGAAREDRAGHRARAGARGEFDVLIVCRGGGSIEDLWAFNEEVVARAIVACAIPVVSGVGHETDFTIADFVADVRAPTPTAAAAAGRVRTAPNSARRRPLAASAALTRVIARALEDRMQRLDYLSRRLDASGRADPQPGGPPAAPRQPAARRVAARVRTDESVAVRDAAQRLRRRAGRTADRGDGKGRSGAAAARCGARAADNGGHAADGLGRICKHLNPQRVLERGYSITETADGAIVRDSAQVAADGELKVTFAKGWAGVQVRRKG